MCARARMHAHTHKRQTNRQTVVTFNMLSKSNKNGLVPKLASTSSPGVCNPTVGYSRMLVYSNHGNITNDIHYCIYQSNI